MATLPQTPCGVGGFAAGTAAAAAPGRKLSSKVGDCDIADFLPGVPGVESMDCADINGFVKDAPREFARDQALIAGVEDEGSELVVLDTRSNRDPLPKDELRTLRSAMYSSKVFTCLTAGVVEAS